MDDDRLEAAWLSFAEALRENERSKRKRIWLMLSDRHSLLSNIGQSPADTMAFNYQRQAMNSPSWQHSQMFGLRSGPLRSLGL